MSGSIPGAAPTASLAAVAALLACPKIYTATVTATDQKVVPGPTDVGTGHDRAADLLSTLDAARPFASALVKESEPPASLRELVTI